MTESKKKEKERARSVYVPPCVELHAAEPSRLMGTSFYSEGHNAGNDPDDNSDHTPGDLILPGEGGSSSGAKATILGQEFGFSDVWEN